MRKDEAAAAMIVRQFLKATLPGEIVRVDPEKDDPPDCWLQVGDTKFACEITSFNDGSRNGSRKCQNMREVDAHFTRLAKRLAEGVFTGHYALFPSGRYLNPRVKKWWRRPTNTMPLQIEPADLESLIAEDVQASQSVAAGPVRTYESRDGVVALEKLATTGCQIESNRVSDAKWEGEITKDLKAALSHAGAKKSKKLLAKKLALQSSVLVIVDRYAFTTQAALGEIASETPELQQFHAVFYLLGNRKDDWHERNDYRHFCKVLWAMDPRWIGPPFEGQLEPAIGPPSPKEHT